MGSVDYARAEHENFIAAIESLAAVASRPLIHRDGGVVALATGAPLRFVNQILIENERASTEALARAVLLMRETGYPFVVNLRAGIDDGYRAVLEGLGLAHGDDEVTPGMALEPLSRLGDDPRDLDIREVRDPISLADHRTALALGFGVSIEIVDRLLPAEILNLVSFSFYAGYLDDEPVVSGLGIRTGSTIGVYNIATVEGARRRGYGAAITRRILVDGAAGGCTVGILQASEMGRPVYEAMGFRTVVTYQGFIETAADQHSDESVTTK